jgi:transcriptional regulator with XRE-family HTH domain
MNSDHSPRGIAQRVKQARQEAGLSQESLGKKLGLSKVGYGEYERVSRLFDTE